MTKTKTLVTLLAVTLTLLTSQAAARGFLTTLLHEDPGDNMKNVNILEYYGRISWSDISNKSVAEKNTDSRAFLTVLMSYEYSTKTIRFHFNMKEPARRGNAFLAETDMQWNTHLDLSNPDEADYIDTEEQTILLVRGMTVNGFTKDSLMHRQTCMFDIKFTEKADGRVYMHMQANPLMGEWCLHRDEMSDVALAEEHDPEVKVRDDLFFQNIEALEHTLTMAHFSENGVEGDWIVTQDDLYSSSSLYRDFFLDHNESGQEISANIVYKVKDYDLVGPNDFHADRPLDKFRSGIYNNKPWLQIKVTFENKHFGKLRLDKLSGAVNHHESTSGKRSSNKLTIELVYPLDEKHLSINKPKRSFRAARPVSAFLTIPSLQVDRQCQGLTFAFQVREEHIKYILEDTQDECFPYSVEGKFYLEESAAEKDEDAMEALIGEIDKDSTGADKKETTIIIEKPAQPKKPSRDELVEDIRNQADKLNKDQIKGLEDVIKKVDKDFVADLRKKKKEHFGINYVTHDYEQKRLEQADWFSRDKQKRKEMHEKNKEKHVPRNVKRDEKMELIGALYATLALALAFAAYHCCYKKKQDSQPAYVHVVPSGPAFA